MIRMTLSPRACCTNAAATQTLAPHSGKWRVIRHDRTAVGGKTEPETRQLDAQISKTLGQRRNLRPKKSVRPLQSP